jgi:VWFA-related protein
VLAQALDQNVIGLSRISEAQGGLGETEKARLSIQALDAIGTAEEKVQGHKVIIWISPGWARLARANTKSNASLFSDIVYFSDLMRDARITLDFINPDGVSGVTLADQSQAQAGRRGGFSSPDSLASVEPTAESGPNWYEAYYGAVKNPNRADVNDLALQVLAHQSGGLVLSKDNRIAPQIARCVNEAAVSYAIFYVPSHRSSSTDYHELEVKIRKVNGTARAREGYYAK